MMIIMVVWYDVYDDNSDDTLMYYPYHNNYFFITIIIMCYYYLQSGWTALHFACANAHSLYDDQIKQPRFRDTITILLGNGADPTALNHVCMYE